MSGPYLEMCELINIYGEGSVYVVNTQLTARYREKLGLSKSDENDAMVLLQIDEDYLSGKLQEVSSGSFQTS